ncbi:CaiB/BaiF CoA transferase family protein [Roseateles toxinivorans]|uniref:Alpha-methylacyl-CoA racemase n=1 Tax=Roseateles toxinivorans TaxID=270368 RepID=A0A4R6QDF4_9BURK|nr:CaiB/BaiF CoA-transferase family protein [Roseateles toxinivorans]TDP60415.1 alpha-methylacyl-CoA racemase [Roseateles toxinivorans]
MTQGPLAGLRVLELAGLGPAPFACALLADAGAEVVRIDRPGVPVEASDILARGRRSVALDLKRPADVQTALALAARADLFVEGFRPGVIERLGLGPDELLQRNPRLVIGRMTGWGQHGPLAADVGHDINYIALSGALASIGTAGGPPVPPLNLVGDFGGGAMLLLFGLLAALHEARQSGRGQVVDAAMVDGSIALMGIFQWMRSQGRWNGPRGGNWLDGGAHFYGCYACADGRWLAVGAIEPAFYRALRDRLDLLDDALFDAQHDTLQWPQQKARLAAIFATRDRDAWCKHFDGSDACVSPVLELDEVAAHPHNAARGAMHSAFGVPQPAPVPRFSRTPGATGNAPRAPGADHAAVLRDWLSPAP